LNLLLVVRNKICRENLIFLYRFNEIIADMLILHELLIEIHQDVRFDVLTMMALHHHVTTDFHSPQDLYFSFI